MKINTSNKALVAWILACALIVFMSAVAPAPAKAQTKPPINSHTICGAICGGVIAWVVAKILDAAVDAGGKELAKHSCNDAKGCGGGGGDAF